MIPVPLFEKLDVTKTELYDNAVEPSLDGGYVLATFFQEKLGLL